jgi:mono/diheme cytochrome c family protein
MKHFIATFLIGAAFLTGCHSVRRGEPIVGPMQLDDKQRAGQIVFQQRCHQCHPYGEAGLGPALNDKPAPVFLMKTQVRAGLGTMPRFDKHIIPDADLDNLMAYVMALRKADKENAVDEESSVRDEPKQKRPRRQESEKPEEQEKPKPIEKRPTPLPPRTVK